MWANARGSSTAKRHKTGTELDKTQMDDNYYAQLPPDDSDLSDSAASGNYIHTTRRRRIRKQQHITTQHTSTTKVPQAKITPPPPITVEKVPMATLLENMKKLTVPKGKVSYKVSRGCIRIFTADNETFTSVMDHCKANNLVGFSHSLKEDQMVRFCLYGLHNLDVAAIASELNTYDLKPEKIRLLYVNKDYPDETIFLICYKKSQNVKLESFRAVTGLQGIRVQFRHYRSREGQITQCANCQSLGHGTKYCFRPAVCVRCAGEHKSSECNLLPEPMTGQEPKEKPKIPENQLKCALCLKTGHSAAWRSCEVRIKQEQEREALRRNRQRQFRRQKAQPPNRECHIQFPATLRPSKTHPLQTAYHIYQPAPQNEQQPQTSQAWRPASKPSAAEGLMPMDECFKIYNHFVSQLIQCTTRQQQMDTIAKLACNYVHNYTSSYPK